MSYLYLVLFKIGNNIFFQFSLLGLIWLSRHEIQNPSHPLAYLHLTHARIRIYNPRFGKHSYAIIVYK